MPQFHSGTYATGRRIDQTFRFQSFREALTFVQKVGELRGIPAFGFFQVAKALGTFPVTRREEARIFHALELDRALHSMQPPAKVPTTEIKRGHDEFLRAVEGRSLGRAVRLRRASLRRTRWQTARYPGALSPIIANAGTIAWDNAETGLDRLRRSSRRADCTSAISRLA